MNLHSHELSESQATPSNYSNQGKSHYTATQSYTQNESGYLQNLIKEYEKSQKQHIQIKGSLDKKIKVQKIKGQCSKKNTEPIYYDIKNS